MTTRKQTVDSSKMHNLGLNFVNRGFHKNIKKFMNINTLSTNNLEHLINTMRVAHAKSSVPNKMQQRSFDGDIHNAGIMGHHYPINTQYIKPFSYTYKPFGTEVLDFNPDTGEFIVYNQQEWNEHNYYKTVNQTGNTLPSLMQYVPMGMELEIIYRNSSQFNNEQCEDCRNFDYDHDAQMETFCEDEYCNSDGDNVDSSPQANKPRVKAYKMLAELNIAFGAVTKQSKPVWIAKHDSSVDLEYVSMPMTLRAYKAGFYLAEYLFSTFRIASEWSKAFYGPCGGHIHLDKGVFNNTYQYFAFLSMHYDNPKFIAAIAQRSIGEDSNWCYMQKPREFATYTKFKRNSQSRGAINVQNNTIELRYFRSNLKVERLLKNVEFAQSLYHYTSQLTYQDIARDKGTLLKYYLLWIKAYRNTYSNLFTYLKERNWINSKQKKVKYLTGDERYLFGLENNTILSNEDNVGVDPIEEIEINGGEI